MLVDQIQLTRPQQHAVSGHRRRGEAQEIEGGGHDVDVAGVQAHARGHVGAAQGVDAVLIVAALLLRPLGPAVVGDNDQIVGLDLQQFRQQVGVEPVVQLVDVAIIEGRATAGVIVQLVAHTIQAGILHEQGVDGLRGQPLRHKLGFS